MEMITERLSLADDGSSDARMRAVDNEKLYLNYIDETQNPFLSNISLPWPYIIVESYLGKCIQVMASVLPYVHVVEEDDDSRVKARRVEKDANMVLYTQKWPIFSYNAYKQAFKYPCAFIWVRPWGNYFGKEMPILQLMNFFHVYVNPSVLTLDDSDAYLIYEAYVPKRIIQQFAGNPYYKNIGKVELHEGQIYTPEEEEIQAIKEKSSYTEDKYSELVKVHYYWSHNDFIMMTNDDNIIRDDRQNFLGRIPVKVIKPIPIDNEFYGMSILEEGKQLFAEINENRNQFNDAANIMLNPQYIVDRERAGLKTRTINSRAGNLIFTDDVNAILPQRQDWQLLMMALRRQGVIENDIMNYSNAFPQLRGQQVAGTETATEYMGMRSAGELRSDTYNLLLAMMGVEDIVKDIVEYKRMFMTDSSQFYYWPEQRTEKVTPEDYEGQFTYKCFAGFKHTQDIERKQMIEAMTLVFGGANGAFLPFVMPKAEEWLDRLLDTFPEIRSPEQLRLSEEERMMAQNQAMVQQFMQSMMGGGGQQALPNLGEKAMRMPESTPNAPMAPTMGSMNV